MSLEMSLTPGWSIKTCADDCRVHIAHPKNSFTDMPMEDFCAMVEYVLMNTDLMKNDPRVELVKRISFDLILAPGYNAGRQRYDYRPTNKIETKKAKKKGKKRK